MNKLNQNVTNGKRTSEVFRIPKWIENFASLNKKKALIRLFILLAITLFFGAQIPKLKFNYDFDSFFPRGDDDLTYYESLNDEFGEFNDFLFVVLKNKKPTDTVALKVAHKTIEDLKLWPDISGIQSPFETKKFQVTPFGINSIRLISPQKVVSQELILSNGLDGKFFGRDGESMMFIIRHQAFEKDIDSEAFMSKLRQYLGSRHQSEYLISGKIQMQHDFTKKLEKELTMLLLLALVFVIIVLSLLFKTLKGVILPLAALVLSIVWTMGFLALTGKSIDVLVVIIPPILLIVALSDVIHFVHKYDDFIEHKLPKEKALKSTVLFIGKATFLTSITTSIGFISLYVIPIPPIRDFGMYTAAGVLFAFLITFLLLPAILYYFPKPLEKKTSRQFFGKTFLDRLFISVLRNKRSVVWAISLVSVILIFGMTELRLNTSLIVGFQKDEPELKEVVYFDNNYDGYKPFEIGIKLSKDRTLFDSQVLEAIERIEDFVAKTYDVRQIESPLSLIRTLNSSLNGASQRFYNLPLENDFNRVKRLYNSPKLEEARLAFQNNTGETIRVIGRSKDIGSAKARVLNDTLKTFLVTQIDPDVLTARLTGTSYLIDKTDNYISRSLVKGLGVAVISVSLFLFMLFRNWRIVLYSLVPNLLPILILFGLMGYFQIDLNISTAIIFTVAFGVAVDDSIHLLARYYLERERFKSTVWALKNSIASTGKSILITSLVLCAGFALFLSSGLSSPFYLGLFIVITAVIALILDLTLLPIIILGIERRSKGNQDRQP